jgi:enoyl-CoA hydratase/carnithine racemase
MPYSTILLHMADHVATITLNRPEQLNCFNRTMVLEFRDLWVRLARRPGRAGRRAARLPPAARSAREST